jgi:TorA maturation chaperone TorD
MPLLYEAVLEEQERADLYALLAALWLAPDAQLLRALAEMHGTAANNPDPLAQSWQALLAAAQRCGNAALAEFDTLFRAAGTPRLNPYRCFYVAGWLMDKPLALLRQDLQRLGLARAAGATELEDHLGALCETMRLLIARQSPLQVQGTFFAGHLAGWTTHCLHDVAGAPEADFYRALAAFTEAFLALEAEALGVEPAPGPDFALPRTASHASANSSTSAASCTSWPA